MLLLFLCIIYKNIEECLWMKMIDYDGKWAYIIDTRWGIKQITNSLCIKNMCRKEDSVKNKLESLFFTSHA